jgi:hypothetical protein
MTDCHLSNRLARSGFCMLTAANLSIRLAAAAATR